MISKYIRSISVITVTLSLSLCLLSSLLVSVPTMEAISLNNEKTYTTIQEAIDDAVDGDIITIPRGIYNEAIRINKSLSLIGANAGDVQITPDGGDDAITITSDNCLIMNLSVSGIMLETDQEAKFISGIYISADIVRIESCSVQFCDIGISIYRSNYVSIINCTLGNNYESGVQVDGGYQVEVHSGYKIENCIFNENLNGIVFTYGEDGLIVNNTITNSTNDGILLSNTLNIHVVDNVITNTNTGIHLLYSTSINVSNVTLENIQQTGIALSDSYWCWINSCQVNAIEIGILLSGSFYNLITNNTMNNSEYGIYLRQSGNNRLINNSCNENSINGILLKDKSNNNIIERNKCNNSGEAGIHIYDSEDNILSNNTTSNNGNRIDIFWLLTFLFGAIIIGGLIAIFIVYIVIRSRRNIDDHNE